MLVAKTDVSLDNALSASDLVNNYLFGLSLRGGGDSFITSEKLNFHIRNAQVKVENTLNIKIRLQKVQETLPYLITQYLQWGYIHTKKPVVRGLTLRGEIGSIRVINFPDGWVNHTEPTDQKFSRTIYIIPDRVQSVISGVLLSGLVPHRGAFDFRKIPNFWRVTYITGFFPVPGDLISAIGKLAAISVLNELGDIIIGAGIAETELEFDGYREEVKTTSSAENSGYSARIRQYQHELGKEMEVLKSAYVGIPLMAS